MGFSKNLQSYKKHNSRKLKKIFTLTYMNSILQNPHGFGKLPKHAVTLKIFAYPWVTDDTFLIIKQEYVGF